MADSEDVPVKDTQVNPTEEEKPPSIISNSASSRRSKRSVKPTEKGKEYSLKVKTENFKKNTDNLTGLINEASKALAEIEPNVEHLRHLKEIISKDSISLGVLGQQILDLEASDEISQSLANTQAEVQSVITLFVGKIAEFESVGVTVPRSVGSHRSTKSHIVKAPSSVRSHRSGRSLGGSSAASSGLIRQTQIDIAALTAQVEGQALMDQMTKDLEDYEADVAHREAELEHRKAEKVAIKIKEEAARKADVAKEEAARKADVAKEDAVRKAEELEEEAEVKHQEDLRLVAVELERNERK